MKFSELKIKLFADCDSDLAGSGDPMIAGYTTNPSLLAGSEFGGGYYYLCRHLVEAAGRLPLSLEVLSETREEILYEAKLLSAMGNNVYVKIPIVTSEGQSNVPIINEVSSWGIRVNVTAVMTLVQVESLILSADIPSIVSIFAGRIADTGVDPAPIMHVAKASLLRYPKCELLWASTREPLNIVQAQDAGCDIITVPPGILAKARERFGGDHHELSIATVRQFTHDAKEAYFRL